MDGAKARTLGITAVSAASLYFKAEDYESAEGLAARWLHGGAPEFAKHELRVLLQAIWAERVKGQTHAGFAPGQVLVSVQGGEVVRGGAPLDLITSKIRTVESIYHRAAEFLSRVGYRRRGQPSKDIQDLCRPWLFQAPPGSYQFAVAVQERRQTELIEHPVSALNIADCFLRILRVGVEDPEDALADVVPDPDYRATFLKLTRNLAPRGNVCESIEIRAADGASPISLDAAVRSKLSRRIRELHQGSDAAEESRSESLSGTLRAVHLDRDWIEVTVDNDNVQVVGVGEQVDDVIGVMVNKPVTVHVTVAGGRRTFVDIEPDD